jgi:tRNA(Ile2) C34 agmatinyltransferase TiaS
VSAVCPLCGVRDVSVGKGGDVWCRLCGEPEHTFVLPVDNSVDNFVSIS